jgi:hypothetical protein
MKELGVSLEKIGGSSFCEGSSGGRAGASWGRSGEGCVDDIDSGSLNETGGSGVDGVESSASG